MISYGSYSNQQEFHAMYWQQMDTATNLPIQTNQVPAGAEYKIRNPAQRKKIKTNIQYLSPH